MTTDQQLQTFLEGLTELERDFISKCAALRMLGTAAADELRRARFEAQHVNLKVYTEAELAEEMKVGESTLRRYRIEYGADWPHMRAGDRVLYTNLHLVEITELLDARRGRREARRLKVAGR